MDDNRPEETGTDPVISDQSEGGSDYSRRGFMEAAGAVAGAAALAGCGGNNNGGSSTTTSGNSGGGGKSSSTKQKSTQDFVFWTMRGYNPSVTQAIKKTAKGFEDAANSPVNVQTNVIVWSQVFPKWNAAIQGRTAPNVSEMACEQAANFGSLGAVSPNTNLYNQYNDWFPAMDVWTKYNNKRWGVPWFVETRPLVYRKDILESAGHSKPPSDWKEMITIAQDVAKNTKYPGFARTGARNNAAGQHMFGYTAQAGGAFSGWKNNKWTLKLDGPGSLFGHLFFASFGKKGWNIAQNGWTGMTNTAKGKFFRTNGAGMSQDEQTTLRKTRSVKKFKPLRSKLGVSEIPTGPDGTRTTFMGGSCLAQFSKKVSKHDVGDLKPQFQKYMIQPDRLASTYEAAAPIMMPVRKSQAKMKLFTNNPTKLKDEWLNAFVKQAANTRRYNVYGGGRDAPYLGAIQDNSTSYSRSLSAILGSGADPKKALMQSANKMRKTASNHLGYTLKQNKTKPKLTESALKADLKEPKTASTVMDWVHGSNGKPQIWNPYK